MKPEEIALIQSKKSASIVAPAGHGKTEMIVDLVAASKGKTLLVTHTNAGIEALKKRLSKRGISSKRYSITTIAGFCLRWCFSYPVTANIQDIPITSKEYYPMLYDGAVAIFQHSWAREVLQKTYTCVIVDEYQDCVLAQHQIFVEINRTLPVIVLGDPLQAIFGWAGKLVSWNNLCFERVNVTTHPWRWEKTNPDLGEYLSNIRSSLEPGLNGHRVKISVEPVDKCIQVMPTSCKYDSSLISIAQKYDDAVYITKLKNDQEAFSRDTSGIFQNDEAQNLTILFEVANIFDKRNGLDSAKSLLEFLRLCATGVKTELISYQKNIDKGNLDFSRIKKYPKFGELIKEVYDNQSNKAIIDVLDWLKEEKSFRLHRKELFSEMRRALVYSCDNF